MWICYSCRTDRRWTVAVLARFTKHGRNAYCFVLLRTKRKRPENQHRTTSTRQTNEHLRNCCFRGNKTYVKMVNPACRRRVRRGREGWGYIYMHPHLWVVGPYIYIYIYIYIYLHLLISLTNCRQNANRFVFSWDTSGNIFYYISLCILSSFLPCLE